MAKSDIKHSGLPAPPTLLRVTSSTAVSITLLWNSGQDGGHLQTFHVFIRPAGTTSFHPSQSNTTISDPGLGNFMNHTVTGLKANTHYQFKVLARNIKGGMESLVVNATTLGKYRVVIET